MGELIKKFQRLQPYQKGFIILPISLILLIYMMTFHQADIIGLEWFLDILPVGYFIGNALAGGTYLRRSMDIKQASLVREKPGNNYEFKGTLGGLAFGLLFAVTLFALKFPIPFVTSLSGAANCYYLLMQMGGYAGTGSRIGSMLMKNPTRERNEVMAIGVTGLSSLIVAAVVVGLAAVSLVAIAGATTIFSGGATLPLWLTCAFFMTSFVSTMMSAADYATKSANFARSFYTNKRVFDPERKCEYRGSFVGVSTGLVVAVVVITGLALAQPYVFAGIVGVVVACAVIATAVSVIGGICSRIGRFLDMQRQLREADAKEKEAKSQQKAIDLELEETDERTNLLKPRPQSHHQQLTTPALLRSRLVNQSDADESPNSSCSELTEGTPEKPTLDLSVIDPFNNPRASEHGMWGTRSRSSSASSVSDMPSELSPDNLNFTLL